MFAAAICGLMLAACGQQEAPPAEQAELRPTTETVPHELTREQLDARRIADLVAINAALQAYHQQNGAYPLSPRQGFTNVVSGGADWIPGLVPTHLQALPREPRMSDDPNTQYWYASSGADYKLIVVGVTGACGPEVERDGVRIDPMRNQNGRCYGYGFWTEGYRER
jgi:hypothetical protein